MWSIDKEKQEHGNSWGKLYKCIYAKKDVPHKSLYIVIYKCSEHYIVTAVSTIQSVQYYSDHSLRQTLQNMMYGRKKNMGGFLCLVIAMLAETALGNSRGVNNWKNT